MYEFGPHEPAEQLIDLDPAFFERILDNELDFDPPGTIEEYNEHRQIAADVQQSVQTMRSNEKTVAESLGISITPDEYAAWQPSQAQEVKLRHELTKQRKMLSMIRGTEAYLEDLEEDARLAGVPLRPYQRAVIDDFHDFMVTDPRLARGGLGKSGFIEMPTGTGKTGVFANIAAAAKHAENPAEPVRVLVLVPTQRILGQTMGRGGERGFGKFAPHIDVGAYYQDEKDLDHEVVVMCTASFNELVKQKKMPAFDMVIVDEAHTVIGETTGKNISAYCEDKVAVGLTATTEYDEERTIYGLFEHPIHRMKLTEAVRGSLAAPVRAWAHDAVPLIDYQTLPSDPKRQRAALREARAKARRDAGIQFILEEVERGVGVVVRCPAGDDVDYARQLALELNKKLVKNKGLTSYRWVKAIFVGGKKQRREDRDEALDYLDEGLFDVAAYVKALGMGWDNHYVKSLVNLAPTTSRVEMVQAIGRVLRLSRDEHGNAVEAHVHDFVDPELGSRQYTAPMALELRSGELLAHEYDATPMVAPRRRQKRRERVEIMDVRTSVVATVALTNEVELEPPSQAEIDRTLRNDDTRVTTGEACRILGVSMPTLKTILTNLGTSPSAAMIRQEDIRVILDLYPGLQADDLPQGEEFIDVVTLARTSPRFLPTFTLLHYARKMGVSPQRFTGEDGTIKFYFDGTTGRQLVEDILRLKLI